MSSLQDKIVHFVSLCAKNNNDLLFNRLVKVLHNKEILDGYSQIQSVLNFPFELEYLIFEILEETHHNEWKSSDLVNSLEIAYRMANYQIDSQPRITSVWTGPIYDKNLIRFKTYETVKQLIDTANDEIFIVGYNFSFQHDTIRDLLRRIEVAADRKCRINLIVNPEERNYSEIKNNWTKEKYLLNIYSWIGTNKQDYTSLHSKLIIIDQKKMFLTSANFSYYGFMKNIETGIVIENHHVVSNIWKQFQSLLKNNQMKKIY